MGRSVMPSSVKQSRRPRSNVCPLRKGVHEPGPSTMLHTIPHGGLDLHQAGACQHFLWDFQPFLIFRQNRKQTFHEKKQLSQFYEDEPGCQYQGQFS